ncbi:unnamed protein product [Caretta caretta]
MIDGRLSRAKVEVLLYFFQHKGASFTETSPNGRIELPGKAMERAFPALRKEPGFGLEERGKERRRDKRG